MDRQHRRELKHDKFVDEVGVLTSKARDNQRVLITIAGAAILLAIAAYGFFFYRSNQEQKAQGVLSAAIETIESPLIVEGSTPNPRARFKTEPEKSAAADKQFKDVAARFAGTDAADVAGLYLARLSAGRGDTATAKKLLLEFVSQHPKHLLVGGARYSLYQMRIDGGEAAAVATELTAELAKQEAEMSLPGDSLLVLLAHAYEAQGNEQKSRDTYKRLVTEFPDSPFALEAQRRVGPA